MAVDPKELARELARGNSSAMDKGDISEYATIEIFEGLPVVKKVVKDTYNSKLVDVIVYLKHDNIDANDHPRAVQVKTLTKVKGKDNAFRFFNINDYPDGTLIVALNKEEKVGLVYFMSSEYRNQDGTGFACFAGKACGNFSKILYRWDKFISKLTEMIMFAPILTLEMYVNSLTSNNLAERLSRLRFEQLCNLMGKQYTDIPNNTAPTDVLMDILKCQLKYSSECALRQGVYDIAFHRQKMRPYEIGQNDFYIIELANFPGYFMFLHRNLLLRLGYLKSDDIPGKTGLHVFDYNYDDNMLKNLSEVMKQNYRNKWCCEKYLWWSIYEGWLCKPGFANIKQNFNEFYNTFTIYLDSSPIIKSIVDNANIRPHIERKTHLDEFIKFCSVMKWTVEVSGQDENRVKLIVNRVPYLYKYSARPNTYSTNDTTYRYSLKTKNIFVTINQYKYFIFELGDRNGEYCIIDNESMINNGCYEDNILRNSFTVYRHDHLVTNGNRKGHWTMNPKYWYSAKYNGRLSDYLAAQK
jgi:hypothetical protein